MKRLGVNIDHVATLRNARGEFHPDLVFAAKFIERIGADSITIHLREDRRHINDKDAKQICAIKNLLVNLEVSTNDHIIKKALKIKPDFICIVPENRKEITTEGGLDLKKNNHKIKINPIENYNSQPTEPVLGFIGAGNYSSRTLLPAFRNSGANFQIICSLKGANAMHYGRKFSFKEVTI